MSSPLPQIKELVSYLPKKDSTLAKKFIEQKDWESLKDLTWSALQMIELAYERGNIPAKYQGLDVDRIRTLALLADEYYYLIYPEEAEVEEDFEYEEEETE